jgi:hypothetical protein
LNFRHFFHVSGWHDVQAILDDATAKLSRREILDRWPAGKPRPERL